MGALGGEGVAGGWTVRAAGPADADAWEQMRQRLWPSAPGEHAGEIARYFEGDRRIAEEVLLAVDESGRALGFAELSIRSHADECYSARVAYLEGWYVEPGARRLGVGAALIRAAEEWGRALGCVEMASDADLENGVSQAAHAALGFEETGRNVHYRKDL